MLLASVHSATMRLTDGKVEALIELYRARRVLKARKKNMFLKKKKNFSVFFFVQKSKVAEILETFIFFIEKTCDLNNLLHCL